MALATVGSVVVNSLFIAATLFTGLCLGFVVGSRFWNTELVVLCSFANILISYPVFRWWAVDGQRILVFGSSPP